MTNTNDQPGHYELDQNGVLDLTEYGTGKPVQLAASWLLAVSPNVEDLPDPKVVEQLPNPHTPPGWRGEGTTLVTSAAPLPYRVRESFEEVRARWARLRAIEQQQRDTITGALALISSHLNRANGLAEQRQGGQQS